MSTWEETQELLVQRHFEVLEVDLPVITGTCTLADGDGYGTPISCDQEWSGEYQTYKFTNLDAPILPESNIYRCISRITENSTKIQAGKGLAVKGSLTVILHDFTGVDPNDYADGVTNTVRNQGTFFGKMLARQILNNKVVRLKLYRLEEDGSVDLENGARTHFYTLDALKTNSNGTYTLTCKDVLSGTNLEEKTWPVTTGGFTRLSVDDTTTSIPVDSEVDYSQAFAVRISDEIMRVISVTGNQTSNATLNVDTRGNSIFAPSSGELLTESETSSHDSGSEVFICDLADNQRIDTFLIKVLTESDLDISLINVTGFVNEVDVWHANDRINTLHTESEDVNDVIVRVLDGFLMDMWFSQESNQVELSAISVWRQSSSTIHEGREIQAYSLKQKADTNLRASRALVVYDKPFLAKDDDTNNYRKASTFSDDIIAGEAFFTEHKDKVFDNNFIIGDNAAQLLTQRYVSRFKFTPFNYSWKTSERYLNFSTGDVVNIIADDIQSFDGSNNSSFRAQITRIKPDYTKYGREYLVSAITYEPEFANNSEIVITDPINSINLHTFAGAPATDVDLTFILAGGTSGGQTAIRAGNFTSGSSIILIMVDGFDAQAQGGNGSIFEGTGVDDGEAATSGGTVYDAEGIDTDIYFSGSTPSSAYPVADGYIRAPGGGGANAQEVPGGDQDFYYDTGGGGAGRPAGVFGADEFGNGGVVANGISVGGDWGQDGSDDNNVSDAVGGLAGSGVKDRGASVVFFGANSTRYINGNGDH